MWTSDEPLRLDRADLYSPRVEAYLQEQGALRRSIPPDDAQPMLVRLVYSNYFYLSVACALGAFVAWAILEPFFDDNSPDDEVNLVAIFMFPTVAGLIGLFLGAVEGIMCRNPARAAISAAVGLGVGFGGALLATIPSAIIFAIASAVALELWDDPQEGAMPTGLALLVVMMGRAAAWAVVALPAGMGQGIAIRENKVILNGMLGAIMGGLIGGLLFDPISMIFITRDGQAAMSRCIGFMVIGVLVGIFIGLVEQWTKSAWLLMKAGPLAGKQFVMYKNPTVLGSSPKADIYLFKDEAIEPRHALLHNRGGRFELEDCGTPDGTYVNGIPIKSHILTSGDQIVLGKTVLEFTLKESK